MLKKWILAALTLTLLCTASPAFALDTKVDAASLADTWQNQGYPDYVGGIYFDEGSGTYTVLLVNGQGEADVRAMLNDPDSVRFASCAYSYAELSRIQQEINHEMETDLERGPSAIYEVSVGWGEEGGFGQSGKEYRVVVGVDKAELDAYREKYATKYGDSVYVQVGEELLPPVNEKLVNRWYIFGILIIMFFPTLRLALGSKLNPLRRYKS